MNIDILQSYMIPVIVVICICVGFVCKQWDVIPDKIIPTIMAVLGLGLAIWIDGHVVPDTIAKGLVSGLASTGLHQLFKQWIDNMEVDMDQDDDVDV